MKVWIDSPVRLYAEALGALIRSLGFEVSFDYNTECDVALWDISDAPPCTASRLVPTLAFIRGRVDAAYLLKRHYRGYLRYSDEPLMLKHALEAVYRGDIWLDGKILHAELGSTI
jgi:hypothetical protein